MNKNLYTQDENLPSHGRRSKAQNAGTVQVHLYFGAESLAYNPLEIFDIYLNIDVNAKTYNATYECDYDRWFSKKPVKIPISIPSDVLSEFVQLAENKEFMSLTEEDIFPNLFMLDGRDIELSVCSDMGKMSLSSNLLRDTLEDGLLPTNKGDFKTPFDRLASIGFEHQKELV